MGLIDKLFGGAKDKEAPAQTAPESTQFHESESTTNEGDGTRNSPKREVVQVMLRDTMRKHGIPSDWIECRILSTMTRSRRIGLHAQFIVRQGHEQLLSYVFAFQDSFMREVTRFDPHAAEWLLSVSWRFDGYTAAKSLMPDPKVWAGAATAGAAATPADAPARPEAAALAAADPEPELTGFEPTQDPMEEDDVDRDLKALFAIRDAVLADTRAPSEPGARPPQDFESTRPGGEELDLPRR
jgi:hypothetical protein